ncbi:MAG: bacterial Ig-like domain-containing protein [Roseburia sp.]|nr:bacterial Ig-like domain-containing protein [Anaeroplasma bactoclasticum]MCM1196452.1 bacterial Ig-like domain-containing protein [Roseburia sp.]
MKKISKVLFALLLVCEMFFFVACQSNKSDPKPDEKPTVELRKALDKIELDTTNVKKEYYLGQSFDSTGLKVTADFTNNTSEDVTKDIQINSQSFDSNALGQYLIIVSYTYEGRVRTSNFTVDVKTILENNIKHLVGLDVNTDPADKEFVYSIGEDVDLTGVSITTIYSDDTMTPIALGDVTLDTTGVDKTKAGNYLVVFSLKESYTSDGVTQEVTVKNFLLVTYLNPVTKIEFKSGKTEFEFGSEFVTTDWVIEATYANNDSATIPAGQYSVSGVSTGFSGEQTVTITYSEMGVTKECKVTVTVGENPDANKPLVIKFNASDLNEVATQISTPLKYGDYITYICKKVDLNDKELDGVQYTKRLNFGGKASASQNMGVIMPGAGTIEVVYSASIKEGEERCIALYNTSFVELQKGDAVKVKNAVQKYTFEISEAGTYHLGSTLSGMYIYGATITIFPTAE